MFGLEEELLEALKQAFDSRVCKFCNNTGYVHNPTEVKDPCLTCIEIKQVIDKYS